MYIHRVIALAALMVGSALLVSCAHDRRATTDDLRRIGRAPNEYVPRAGNRLSIRWTQPNTWSTEDGRFETYTPIESAAVAIRDDLEKVFIANSRGEFRAQNIDGKNLFSLELKSPVYAAPVITKNDVFVISDDGKVRAIDQDSGKIRWETELGHVIRRAPVVNDEAIFVVSEDDAVLAIAQSDGEILWSRARDEIVDGLLIEGHAGLTLAGNTLLTATSDGLIWALDTGDGSDVWTMETAVDVVRDPGRSQVFYDVDTTPVVIDGVVYAAAYDAGLYALSLRNGTLLWRDDQIRGARGLASVNGDLLIVGTAFGISRYETSTRNTRWHIDSQWRGNMHSPRVSVDGRTLFISETKGGVLAFDTKYGKMCGRLGGSLGYSSAASLHGGYGWVQTNGGDLVAFELSVATE